jgi:GDPmannose 4,6-dehydratase
MPKSALITGITGQDAAYLAKLLLGKGYQVFGAYRRGSSVDFWRLEFLGVLGHPRLELVEFDLTDFSSALRILAKTRPDEVYNLAAQSFVGVSFEQPLATAQITGVGVVNLLEAIRQAKPDTRFYQASTSEMFGATPPPQAETSLFHPRSPYAAAKLYAHWMTVNYRESYGLFAVSGVLFNHESPLRGLEFVTRKITDAAAKIKLGLLSHLELGNLSARRDWGFAGEYVDGMYRMLQTTSPDDFVLATGRSETVRDFASLAFQAAGIPLSWRGEGKNEEGFDPQSGRALIQVNPKFYRPAEVDALLGNPQKARAQLQWEAATTLEQLASLMTAADLRRNQP